MEPKNMDALLRRHLHRSGVLPEGETCWRVEQSKLGGRGLIATRDIRQGELIYVDVPLIIGPRCYNKYLPMCVNCYKNQCPLFPCERGCGLPICSDKCENSIKHQKSECDYLRSLKPTCGSMWSLELLQAVVPIRALGLTEDERNLIYSFECHDEAQHGREVDMIKSNVEISPKVEDENFMRKVCRVLDTGSFETAVVRAESSTSLRALYPMGALQNHSCVPNTRHHFDKSQKVYVHAALPISKGEEITMTYTDLTWDTTLRRHFLRATKHFSCNCSRCADPTEFGSFLGALKCAKDICSGILLPDSPLDYQTSWSCDTCHLTITNRQITSIRSGVTAAIEEVIYESPKKMLKFIERELCLLVPATSYIMMEMMYRIVSLFGRAEGYVWEDLTDHELNTKGEYCDRLLKCLDAVGCGECKKKGLILYESYCTNVEKFKRIPLDENNGIAMSRKEIDVCNNERSLLEATKILQNDIAAPSDYHGLSEGL